MTRQQVILIAATSVVVVLFVGTSFFTGNNGMPQTSSTPDEVEQLSVERESSSQHRTFAVGGLLQQHRNHQRQSPSSVSPLVFRPGMRFPKGVTPLTLLQTQKPQHSQPSSSHTNNNNNRGGGGGGGGAFGWTFVKYHPSPFEQEWLADAPAVERKNWKTESPLCDMLLKHPKYRRRYDIYVKELPRMTPDSAETMQHCPADDGGDSSSVDDVFPSEPLSFDPDVFSRFEYRYDCIDPPCNNNRANDEHHHHHHGGKYKLGEVKYTYIEPLVGLLRHPKSCQTRDLAEILNKNYMIVDAWSLANVGSSRRQGGSGVKTWGNLNNNNSNHNGERQQQHQQQQQQQQQQRKVLYFDAGASVWDSGAGGASQSWFWQLYESMCLGFTDMFMWELTKHDPSDIFAKIPGHLKPSYRWFNIPVQTSLSSWDNPLNHLLVQATREDVVVFKIDFDAPQIEGTLVDQILEYSRVSELIDELYFEHHVKMEVLAQPWEGFINYKLWHSDSVKMFMKLREKGIRAHSWL